MTDLTLKKARTCYRCRFLSEHGGMRCSCGMYRYLRHTNEYPPHPRYSFPKPLQPCYKAVTHAEKDAVWSMLHEKGLLTEDSQVRMTQ